MSRPDQTSAYRDLLAAVLEALDIPHPATVGDAEVHDRILVDRVMHARVALRTVVEADGEPLLGLGWTTAYLREQLAKTLPPATPPGASGERPCGGRAPYGARRRDPVR